MSFTLNKFIILSFIPIIMTLSVRNNVFRNENNYRSETICNILSLSGGGSHGAFESGVVSNLTERGKTWNTFYGISAGSLNSLFLSRYRDQKEAAFYLKNIYSNLKNSDVYTFSISSLYKGKSLYDTKPLHNLVINEMSKTEFNYSIYPTYLGATSLNMAQLSLFSLEKVIDNELISKMVMASSAIPFLFPAIEVDAGDFYVDGGVKTDELIYEPSRNCDEIEMDMVLSYNPHDYIVYKTGWNFFSVIERVIQIVYHGFNNRVVEAMGMCRGGITKKGNMNIYYPASNINVSLLDFTKGKELWKMGYENYVMNRVPLCF